MSTCPETETDNKRIGRGIIVTNVSEMYLCAFLQWPQGLDDKEYRHTTMRNIILFILKSASLIDGLTHGGGVTNVASSGGLQMFKKRIIQAPFKNTAQTHVRDGAEKRLNGQRLAGATSWNMPEDHV